MGRDIKLWPSVSASDLVGDSQSTHSQQLEMAGFKQEVQVMTRRWKGKSVSLGCAGKPLMRSISLELGRTQQWWGQEQIRSDTGQPSGLTLNRDEGEIHDIVFPQVQIVGSKQLSSEDLCNRLAQAVKLHKMMDVSLPRKLLEDFLGDAHKSVYFTEVTDNRFQEQFLRSPA